MNLKLKVPCLVLDLFILILSQIFRIKFCGGAKTEKNQNAMKLLYIKKKGPPMDSCNFSSRKQGQREQFKKMRKLLNEISGN